VNDPIAVLLVEDNPVSQKISIFLLKKLGVEADVALTGEEAVRMAGEKPYQLILMDIELPGMKGFEATREIRKQECRMGVAPPVPIVAMTAHDGDAVEHPCKEAGMNTFIAKPLKPARVKALLENLEALGPDRTEETTVQTTEDPDGSERGDREGAGMGSAATEKTSESILKALEEAGREEERNSGETPLRHLIVFSLGDEKYALDVKHLKNVMWARKITPVPDVPPHVLGIMNIRGEIISVVDLKQLLGLDQETPVRVSVMVTSEKGVDVGFLVDGLDEIVDLPTDSIDPPLITFEKECTDFIDGEARVNGRLMAVLNYEKIMASKQMTMGTDPRMER